jgi:putative transposase
LVAAHRGSMAGLAAGVRAVEDRFQPLRPLVKTGQVEGFVPEAPDRHRRRVAQHRRHDQPGAPTRGRRKRGVEVNAIGRSRGGPTTKVHLVVDALGLPVAFEITAGNRHDSLSAPSLIATVAPQCLLGDKAYDVDAIRANLSERGAVAVIPPKANRKTPAPFDKELYKARSEVERTFNLLKQARRFATRYEKTLRNYAAVVAIGCAMLS